MPAEVKDEPLRLRQRQALETRRTIARAARELFADGGYAATSIGAVAEKAGVAERTVYSIFGTKKAILGAICEEWLAEAGIRETLVEGLKERNLRRRLALVAHSSRRQWESERGVVAMLDGAAASDVEVARMLAGWKTERTTSLNGVVGGCELQLRDDIQPKRAGAIIRALTGAEIFSELVRAEGWTSDEYESWLSGLLVDLLVKRR